MVYERGQDTQSYPLGTYLTSLVWLTCLEGKCRLSVSDARYKF